MGIIVGDTFFYGEELAMATRKYDGSGYVYGKYCTGPLEETGMDFAFNVESELFDDGITP